MFFHVFQLVPTVFTPRNPDVGRSRVQILPYLVSQRHRCGRDEWEAISADQRVDRIVW
jgi:hypothetical protein